MKTIWTVTGEGSELLTRYAGGEEIPADLAEKLPPGSVKKVNVSQASPEPSEPGVYLINGKTVALLEPSSGALAPYPWRRVGTNAQYKWEGVFNWDAYPYASVQRLMPEQETCDVPLPLFMRTTDVSVRLDRLASSIHNQGKIAALRLGTSWPARLAPDQVRKLRDAMTKILGEGH